MCYLVKDHRLLILVLTISLTCLMAVTTQSPVTSARAQGGSPLRLRLRVQRTTLRPGDETKIFAEFLDRNYQQVPNDGTRVIEFGRGAAGPTQTGAGDLSPRQVTVRPGEWSAETTFVSSQSGRVLITAHTSGLDPAQTLLVVTPPGRSFLSGLFETVAYAQETQGFELTAIQPEATANGNSRALFQVSFTEPPPAGTRIRISVAPPASIIQTGKSDSTVMLVNLAPGEAGSDEIAIKSSTTAQVKVTATVLPNGPTDQKLATFTQPEPWRIIFSEGKREISSSETSVPISVELADKGFTPVQPIREERIILKSAIGDGFMSFDQPIVVLKPGKKCATTTLHWNALPMGNELTVLADAVQDGEGRDLTSGQKTIIIHSPIQKVMLTGPVDVTQGTTKAEFTVQLADKDGKHLAADVNRTINLSASKGWFSPNQVTIRKGEDLARVHYRATASAGKAVLTAQSVGLTDASRDILLLTAPFWLNLYALLGGLGGALVRQLHKDPTCKRILPEMTAEGLQFGLLARIACCVFCGLILYWTMKLGLAGMIGVVLPATLDLGTSTAACLLGATGGFAGTVVLARLVNVFVPGRKEEEATNPAPAESKHARHRRRTATALRG